MVRSAYLELGEGIPTLDGGTDTYLGCGRGYLLWKWEGIPTLDVGGGTYLGWKGEGLSTSDGEKGYLPSMGRGYLPWMGEGVMTSAECDKILYGLYNLESLMRLASLFAHLTLVTSDLSMDLMSDYKQEVIYCCHIWLVVVLSSTGSKPI